MFWRSSERAIRQSVRSAMAIAKERGYRSIAFPLIGAGSGGVRPSQTLEYMKEELRAVAYDGEVVIVRYR